MGKPSSIPVPEAEGNQSKKSKQHHNQPQEPLSGSKKTKKHNHTPHLNPEGS